MCCLLWWWLCHDYTCLTFLSLHIYIPIEISFWRGKHLRCPILIGRLSFFKPKFLLPLIFLLSESVGSGFSQLSTTILYHHIQFQLFKDFAQVYYLLTLLLPHFLDGKWFKWSSSSLPFQFANLAIWQFEDVAYPAKYLHCWWNFP